MSNYKYTARWFLDSDIRRDICKYLNPSEQHTILEIGCYEGLSSVFFADTLLNHSGSTLTCVDPYLTLNTNDHGHLLQNNEEANFDYNITHCNNAEKIHIHKITSDTFFEQNTKIFDMIYIDGSHQCENIRRDMINSFKYLASNGIMWMDDYLGDDGIRIKNTMDSVLSQLNGQYKFLQSGYQIAIQKI